MNAETLVRELKYYNKGAHVQLCWRRDAKTLKSVNNHIEKETCAWVRAGIAYENLKAVKDGIESGERGPVEELPWGQWRPGHANYIIDHESKDGISKEYVRLYPAVFDNLKSTVQWYKDGQPVSFEEIEPMLLASEKREDREVTCFTVRPETIQWVN